MAVHILDAMAREGFEQVLALHDRASGLRGFLGLHDTRQGPAFGGIRRLAYRDEKAALLDCLRLSKAMTEKCVLADLPAGGGKLVIMDREGLDLERAYRHVGRVVEQLGGRFYTGPDMGTGQRELGWVAAETRYATQPGDAGPGLLAESTAAGVFAGIRAALGQVFGSPRVAERTVVVQGLGQVGERLAALLIEGGAHVFGAEVDSERAQRVSAELGVELVPPGSEFRVPCDVFAPCAQGGILHDLSLEGLASRIVAGAANNVLARGIDGDRLHERGILYVPDVVICSGAVIRGAIFHLEGRRESLERIGERVGRTCERILQRAAEEDESPARVATREALERLGDSLDAPDSEPTPAAPR